MSWPTRTWTQDGWRNFNNPMANRRPEGLPADWEDVRGNATKDSATFWDVIENPLYEAAANASGIDWDEWVADSLAAIGSEEDYEAAADWADDRTPSGRPSHSYNYPGRGHYPGQNTSDSDYDNLTPEQQAIADQFPDPRPTTTGGNYPGRGTGNILDLLTGKDDDDQRDWGVDRGAFGDILDELDEMGQWLRQTIKTHDLSDAPIIRRGPEGSDYGIDGDIWEYYGLDQAPGPPAEMDINYEFNLLDARPSTQTYATPAGYPQLDTSTESMSGPTSYDTYMSDRRAEYEAFHDPNRPATSYGEVVVPEVEESEEEEETTTEPTYTWHSDSYSFSGDSRWTDNVQKIIGNDQDVELWAEFAGVTNLNSRNDSNTIKELFNANNGVLPTTRD